MNRSTIRPSRAVALLAACSALLAAGIAAPRADAAISFESFAGSVVDDAGGPFTQAGGHPYSAKASFALDTLPNGNPVEDAKDVTVSLPPGFIGVPTTVPECDATLDVETWLTVVTEKCPVRTQVGVAIVKFDSTLELGNIPVYNIEPPPGVAARFAFGALVLPVVVDAVVRPDDFGVDLVSRDTSQGLTLVGFEMTLWGVPADESHDAERVGAGAPQGSGGAPSGEAERAFIANPMHCAAGLLTTTIRANSWQHPDQYATASFDHDVSQTPPHPMAVENCDAVPFEPTLGLQPTSKAADSPTGVEVDLSIPQSGLTNPVGIASGHLKRAKVTLPEGMTISPSAADGLAACSDAQLGLGVSGAAQCPDASRIGTVTVDTPLLDNQLGGSVFIRSQNSDDPMSGEMFRIAIEVRDDERGIAIKLPGQVRANPQTGRIETTFDNNPQLPFTNMRLRFKGGPRAPLVTPAGCGVKTTVAELTTWARPDQPVVLTDAFTIACPGQTGFAPRFDAGSMNPVGASFSPFAVRIERDDRQQFLSGVEVDLPKGLLAKLRGVPLCGSEQATNGGCPAGSRIGTATVGAGPGSSPYYVNGDVYLTEGYKGGPYGMAVHVHAKAGPFDLGWVRVRQALYVDRVTAEVSVVSDPLPQIVKGVPVRLRDVRVDVDKPDFTVNPTSCSEQRVDTVLTSINRAAHRTGSRFQVGDCQALPFEPRLGLRLTGRKQIRTGRHPGVRAVVRQSGIGEAGIDRARVVLPKSLALDPENAQALCEFDDGTKPDLENHCPKGSIVGRARAKTPLLDRDLVGDVYFVKNVRISKKTGNEIRTLPMIVVALRGEIAINLTGKSSTTKSGRLVNTFANVPDAPIGRFNLNIKGGRNGILAVTRTRRAKINLCAKPNSHIADNKMNGQNGKRADYDVRVKTPCAKKAGKKSKRRASASAASFG